MFPPYGGRRRTALVALAFAIALAGCGRGGEEHAGGHEGGPAPPPPLPIGQAGDPGAADATIEVEALDSMSFRPRKIEVAQGDTIHFVVTNAGKAPHEFTLGDDGMQQEHAEEMEGMGGDEAMAHDHPYAVMIEPGETKELTWNFTEAGEFSYACHVPGHYEAGMKAPLIVE